MDEIFCNFKFQCGTDSHGKGEIEQNEGKLRAIKSPLKPLSILILVGKWKPFNSNRYSNVITKLTRVADNWPWDQIYSFIYRGIEKCEFVWRKNASHLKYQLEDIKHFFFRLWYWRNLRIIELKFKKLWYHGDIVNVSIKIVPCIILKR